MGGWVDGWTSRPLRKQEQTEGKGKGKMLCSPLLRSAQHDVYLGTLLFYSFRFVEWRGVVQA